MRAETGETGAMKRAVRATLIVAALLAAGCKQPAPPATAPAPATPGPAQPAGKAIKIAMIAKSSTNPVFLSARARRRGGGRRISTRKTGVRSRSTG